MYNFKYVFSQLTAFLNRSKFNRLVAKYNGDRYVKHFSCWNQLLTLMFGQLSNRESLRDLIVSIEAHHRKWKHLGFGMNVTRSNLSKANTNRVRGQRTSSSLTVTSMPLTLLLSRYAWMSFGGQNSVSIRAVSRYIHCMIWRPRFQPSSTSPRHRSMIRRR